MHILKEYSALMNAVKLTDENSIALSLVPENNTAALDYIEQCTNGTDISYKTLNPLKIAAGDIFNILSQSAEAGEEVCISCTYHKYYYMLLFEFSEAALPLHTLNKAVKVLDPQHNSESSQEEIGFMNIVHLVNRISLSVDKITEKMRISIIKEKKYPAPKPEEVSPLVSGTFEISYQQEALSIDFTRRVFERFGQNIDTFLITPGLFIDNMDAGELEAVFLRDVNGNCAGGAVWQKTYGIIILIGFFIFISPEDTHFHNARTLLLHEFEKNVNKTDASFIVSKIEHSDIIADYFNLYDEVYNYKSLSVQKRQTSYIKPDLMPLIKKAYKSFEVNREIREINYNYNFFEPYSVISTMIDTISSEALLSVLCFGDDLKSNIIRHIIALRKIGIDKIYFRLDLGLPEEAAISDLVQSCGFEAQYLWPYSSDKGDIVVFLYYESSVYEMKPCTLSSINKSNIEKTPELVRKVYGDNYPSQYLYKPEKLWEKIRKRHVYPYIAIDEEAKAVGMIAFVKLESNPYLFEIGQLMVDPKHRGTNVVNQLIEYINKTAIHTLDFDAVLSESVTNHKLSQRSCINSGFCDTALKLNIMSASAFELEEERRRIGRMSCVVSCIERADETFSVYLPEQYASQIGFCFEGLKPRCYEKASELLPEQESITEYRINDDEAEISQLINVTIFNVGSDIEFVIEKIEKYAERKAIKTMLINIPLCDVHNGAAVRLLKKRGFFFGGVMPYWLPESDAFLMQKLYNNSPDWDNIKLFSKKIREIAKIIKNDMKGIS